MATDNAVSVLPEADQMLVIFEQRNSLVQDIERMRQMIAVNPVEFGLKENGLCHLIAQKLDENELLTKLTDMESTSLADYTNESDNQIHFGALHWCAASGYSNVAKYLIDEGCIAIDSKATFSLTPLHAAAILGEKNFVGRILDDFIIELSATNILGFELNALHFALMRGDDSLVGDIFRICKKKEYPIDPYVGKCGNLFHLIVYIGYKAQSLVVDIEELAKLIFVQYKPSKIIALLSGKDNNHENCTPLELAAKYNQAGLIHAFIDYMKIHVEESDGTGMEESTFYSAVEYRKPDVVKMFIHYYRFVPSNFDAGYCKYTTLINKQRDCIDEQIVNLITLAEKKESQNKYKKPDGKTQVYENLVLSGGGAKGFVYPYALESFQNYCTKRSEIVHTKRLKDSLSYNKIVRIVGTSAGALCAMALAIGYSPKEMKEKFTIDFDFAQLLEVDNVQEVIKQFESCDLKYLNILTGVLNKLEVKVDNIMNLYKDVKDSSWPKLTAIKRIATKPFTYYTEVTKAIEELHNIYQNFSGFCTGNKLLEFLKELLSNKHLSADLTFGDLKEYCKPNSRYKHLHVVVTNLTTGNVEVLSSENPVYANYIIVDAVRASMSYPILFTPHKLRIKELEDQIKTLQDEYVDGGILRNYAIDEFDLKKYTYTGSHGDRNYPVMNKKTIGFRFKTIKQNIECPTEGPKSLWLVKSFLGIYTRAEYVINSHMDSEYHRSIVIDTTSNKKNGPNITTFTIGKLSEEAITFLEKQSNKAIDMYFNDTAPTDQNDSNNEEESECLEMASTSSFIQTSFPKKLDPDLLDLQQKLIERYMKLDPCDVIAVELKATWKEIFGNTKMCDSLLDFKFEQIADVDPRLFTVEGRKYAGKSLYALYKLPHHWAMNLGQCFDFVFTFRWSDFKKHTNDEEFMKVLMGKMFGEVKLNLSNKFTTILSSTRTLLVFDGYNEYHCDKALCNILSDALMPIPCGSELTIVNAKILVTASDLNVGKLSDLISTTKCRAERKKLKDWSFEDFGDYLTKLFEIPFIFTKPTNNCKLAQATLKYLRERLASIFAPLIIENDNVVRWLMIVLDDREVNILHPSRFFSAKSAWTICQMFKMRLNDGKQHILLSDDQRNEVGIVEIERCLLFDVVDAAYVDCFGGDILHDQIEDLLKKDLNLPQEIIEYNVSNLVRTKNGPMLREVIEEIYVKHIGYKTAATLSLVADEILKEISKMDPYSNAKNPIRCIIGKGKLFSRGCKLIYSKKYCIAVYEDCYGKAENYHIDKARDHFKRYVNQMATKANYSLNKMATMSLDFPISAPYKYRFLMDQHEFSLVNWDCMIFEENTACCIIKTIPADLDRIEAEGLNGERIVMWATERPLCLE